MKKLKNIQVGFYTECGEKSDLCSLGLYPDKMKNKDMLSVAEIPSTGFIVELLESKFL